MAKEEDYSWIVPLIGAASLIGAFLFSSNQNNSSGSSTLPPPPPNQKPSGCGCNHK